MKTKAPAGDRGLPRSRGFADGDERVSEILADALAGDPIDALVDRVAGHLTDDLPGWQVVVAARSGAARLVGRPVDLPRRVVLALDQVATSSGPGPTGHPTAPLRADLATAPWSQAGDDLARAGLGAPLVAWLVSGSVPVGVVAAFPATAHPVGSHAASSAIRSWAPVAAILLARAADHERLRREAPEDDVTGLPARSVVLTRLREALHVRPPRPMALIHVSISRIDALEDSLAGTRQVDLLKAVGRRIRAAVRPGDVVGHVRSRAFLVICADVDAAAALEVGERVRRALAAPVELGAHEVACDPGVGVVTSTDADTVSSLLHKAAIAAREAVRRGGSEVVRYRPGTYEAAIARMDIERDLRRALSRDELRLVYQPQVALEDRSLVGAEALVRWHDPRRGVVSPAAFIPVAEETGLVVALGAWVIDAALAAMAEDLSDLVVSVNLSARQLDQPGLVADLAAALDRHRIDPARLCLELTESALVRDVAHSTALLRAVHELGVRVAIDDFGTGYASLEHLRQVEVADTLKIDQVFVAGIVDDARDRAIVSAAITLGRSLGFRVVAEGVEDEAQADILTDLGCHAGQGYLFGQAVASTAELHEGHPPRAGDRAALASATRPPTQTVG